MSARESNRVKDADKRRILDEAARNRRARKALEALEQDNFHDDPHADLVMSKKVPKFHDSLLEQSRGGNTAGGIGGGGGGHNTSGTKNKRKNADYIKAKYRKTFAQLLEEDRNGGSSGRYAAASGGGGGMDDDADSAAATSANNNNNNNSGGSEEQRVTYASAAAPPSVRPPRHFCAVCGFPSTYTCTSCGVRYCCIKCLGTHRDTRCLKWTA